MRHIKRELKKQKASNLLRKLRTFSELGETSAVLNGKRVVLFASNDYLGLSKDARLKKTAAKGIEKCGLGSGASPLISGFTEEIARLSGTIARFENTEAALVFTTGYQANVGTITALAAKNDLVALDKLSHASIIDGARLSGAELRVYPHNNTERLREILGSSKIHRRKIIVTDGVFSMDGDIAPLKEIVKIKKEFDAILMVDEAHGTGVFGGSGRGAGEFCGVEEDVDIKIGTLSKAVGALGGFVAGKKELIDYLVNFSRSLIFSTALPPAVCAAAAKGIKIIETEPALREKLWGNVKLLREGLKRKGWEILGEGPIIPVIVGEEEKALELSAKLFEKGFFVPAIRYPAVAKGAARLRITVSAAHSKEDLNGLIGGLELRN